MSGILKVGGSELINDNGGSGSLQWGSGVPAGSVIQVVPFTSSSSTNVTGTATTGVLASKKAITLKTDNPLILYNTILGYESDTSGVRNFFFELRYSFDNSTYTETDSTTRINGTHVDNSLGTGSVTIVSHHDTSSLTGFDTGSTIYYQVYFEKNDLNSVQFNQQSLGGQPSGTSNITSGYIMEVQQ